VPNEPEHGFLHQVKGLITVARGEFGHLESPAFNLGQKSILYLSSAVNGVGGRLENHECRITDPFDQPTMEIGNDRLDKGFLLMNGLYYSCPVGCRGKSGKDRKDRSRESPRFLSLSEQGTERPLQFPSCRQRGQQVFS
jgi:hypothetical protein